MATEKKQDLFKKTGIPKETLKMNLKNNINDGAIFVPLINKLTYKDFVTIMKKWPEMEKFLVHFSKQQYERVCKLGNGETFIYDFSNEKQCLVLIAFKDHAKVNVFANAFIAAIQKTVDMGWKQINILLAPKLIPNDHTEKYIQETASLAELSRYNPRFLSQKDDNKKEEKNNGLEAIMYILDSQEKKNNIKQYELAMNEGKVLGQMTNGARELVALPGNLLYPELLWQRAKNLAKDLGLKAKVFTLGQLEKMGMNGIIAVGQGSQHAPNMIMLEYKGKKKSQDIDLALVGKGITFDTGGISLKPGTDMHEMKGDMGGAAAVLYALAAISQLNLPINVTAIIAAAENMPDGKAQRPGDVFQTYSGLTVEVLNTDAEGRLVLADALAYAAKQKAKRIIDVATLTGASMIALGTHLSALFANNKEFGEIVFQAGERSLDRVWPMPLYQDYQQDIKSDIADIANIGPRWGGAITAAIFLNNFVPETSAWAHIDIAPKFLLKKDSGLHRKGPTGFGVRLLYQTAKDIASD